MTTELITPPPATPIARPVARSIAQADGATAITPASRIEQALAHGDLSQLTTEDRMEYLREVCRSCGLNPLTHPFAFIVGEKGRISLYLKKEGAEQLRRNHDVSLKIASMDVDEGGVLVVRITATIPSAQKGKKPREDEDLGTAVVGKFIGEARANAYKKAVTNAKRRVTMSICGLGFLIVEEGEESSGQVVEADQLEVALATARQAPQLPPSQPQALPAPKPGVFQEIVPTRAAEAQIAELVRLRTVLQIEDTDWRAIVGKRGVTTARDLSVQQASELITKLAHMAVANQLEAEMGATDQAAQDQAGSVYSPDGLPVNPALPYHEEGKGPAPTTFPGAGRPWAGDDIPF